MQDDMLERRYLKLPKCLLHLLGHWPHQDKKNSIIHRTIMSSILSLAIITEVTKIITDKGALQTVMEVIPIFCAAFTAMVKSVNCIFNASKMCELLRRMHHNWRMLKTKEILSIMQYYTEDARRYAIFYTINIYIVGFLFGIIPLTPMVLDMVAPLNTSRPRIFVYEAEYLFDKNKYFWPVLIHMWCALIVLLISVTAVDSMFLHYVQHACGLFTVTGYELEHAMDELEFQAEEFSYNNVRHAYGRLRFSIEWHRRSTEFAALIESAHVGAFSLQAGSNIICLCFTLMQISLLFGKSSEVVIYICFAAAQLFHLLCMTYSGQRITDHANDVFFNAYKGLWYNAPIKMQKLLILVMRRSVIPCVLTGGGIFVLSIENFATVIKTSVSYFTVLSTMNE